MCSFPCGPLWGVHRHCLGPSTLVNTPLLPTAMNLVFHFCALSLGGQPSVPWVQAESCRASVRPSLCSAPPSPPGSWGWAVGAWEGPQGRVVFSLPARVPGHCDCLHTSWLPVDTEPPPSGWKVSTWEPGCVGASKTVRQQVPSRAPASAGRWGQDTAVGPSPGGPKSGMQKMGI